MLYIEAPFISVLCLTLIILFMAFEIAKMVSLRIGYTIVILLAGGMIVLFLYICGFSVSEKRSVPKLKYYLVILRLTFMFRKVLRRQAWGLPSLSQGVQCIYAVRNLIILIFAAFILLLGLLVALTLSSRLAGPFKRDF